MLNVECGWQQHSPLAIAGHSIPSTATAHYLEICRGLALDGRRFVLRASFNTSTNTYTLKESAIVSKQVPILSKTAVMIKFTRNCC
jgi:hypothetical protein